MSKALIASAPYAVELIKSSLNICNNIMQYRAAVYKLEIERESMHRNADLAMLKEQQQYERQMQRMRQLSTNLGLNLEHNRSFSSNTVQMYKGLNEQVTGIIKCLSEPSLSNDIKSQLIETMTLINTQLSQLAKDHYTIANNSFNAFIHTCDELRDSPGTFTDVN